MTGNERALLLDLARHLVVLSRAVSARLPPADQVAVQVSARRLDDVITITGHVRPLTRVDHRPADLPQLPAGSESPPEGGTANPARWADARTS